MSVWIELLRELAVALVWSIHYLRTEKNVKVRAVGREKRERELLIQDTYFRMKRSELSAFGGLTMPIYVHFIS